MVTDEKSTDLLEEHARLEAELQEELKRPMPDQNAIAEIKRAKLRVKDELAGTQ